MEPKDGWETKAMGKSGTKCLQGEVWGKPRRAASDKVWNLDRSRKVRIQIWESVRNRVGNQVLNQVRDQILDQVEIQVEGLGNG